MNAIMLLRVVPGTAGVLSAAFLVHADKSPWVWGWFLAYAAANIFVPAS